MYCPTELLAWLETSCFVMTSRWWSFLHVFKFNTLVNSWLFLCPSDLCNVFKQPFFRMCMSSKSSHPACSRSVSNLWNKMEVRVWWSTLEGHFDSFYEILWCLLVFTQWIHNISSSTCLEKLTQLFSQCHTHKWFRNPNNLNWVLHLHRPWIDFSRLYWISKACCCLKLLLGGKKVFISASTYNELCFKAFDVSELNHTAPVILAVDCVYVYMYRCNIHLTIMPSTND